MNDGTAHVRYVPSPGGTRRLEHSEALLDELARIARSDVKPAVERAAPRRTGAYLRSIRVARDTNTVAITSADPFAHIVEFGSRNNPAYAPLRRGVRAAGLRLDESRL